MDRVRNFVHFGFLQLEQAVLQVKVQQGGHYTCTDRTDEAGNWPYCGKVWQSVSAIHMSCKPSFLGQLAE
jgi:hypothetical protein